jgi:UDP-glucuronate 4-epimerase
VGDPERTFLMVKPDGVRRALIGEVVRRIEAKGYHITEMKMFTIDEDLARRHYAEHVEKPFFTDLVSFITSGPVVAMVVEGADVVLNLAAMPGLPRSWSELELYMTCNLLAVQRLVEACLNTGIDKFVQASTSSVYGRRAVGDEFEPLRPISPYGVTKLAAENLLLAYGSEHGFPATILRYFSLYGPRQRPDMAYHRIIEAMLTSRPVTIFGDGQQSRSNTFVSDAVYGTIRAIAGAAVGEVYNIGGGVPITLEEAVGTIGACLGVVPRIQYGPSRPGDQRVTMADGTKARQAFGYSPAVPPERGLPDQVAWHLNGGPGRRQHAVPDRAGLQPS